MITVYITYDRYEHDEWFYVYRIGRSYNKIYTHFIEEDLPSFLNYGPDDCHSFQLQELHMSEYMYRKLRKWVNAEKLTDDEQKQFDNLMTRIYDGEFESDTLIFTDGCSDNYAIIKHYCGERPKADDYANKEQYEKAMQAYGDAYDELQSDNELYERVSKEYVRAMY